MSTSLAARPSTNSCQHCGKLLEPGAAFCASCGNRIASATPITEKSPVTQSQEFERQLRVAWSCLKDVEGKADAISEVKRDADRAINDGAGDVSAKAARQGRLYSEFNQSLDIAWKSGEAAARLNAGGSVQIDGVEITPRIIFATVYSLRGDLMFALEKWDEAVGFYTRCLQLVPDDTSTYHDIGAAYTNKHDAPRALAAFQKVVELDPTGDVGIEAAKAIEKLRAGIIGRKGFTGSWKVVAVLGVLTMGGILVMGQVPSTGVFNLILWGGILALYCWRKYK